MGLLNATGELVWGEVGLSTVDAEGICKQSSEEVGTLLYKGKRQRTRSYLFSFAYQKHLPSSVSLYRLPELRVQNVFQ